MNKRKRVAMLKHRHKRKRYEAQRKAALLAGTIPLQTRQRTTPRLVETPLEQVAATAPRRARRTARAQGQEATAAQAVTTEAAPVEETAPRRVRRTKAAEATAEEKPKRTRRTTAVANDDKAAEEKPKRTRRTTKKPEDSE